jgi:hypothetical protein
MSIKMVIIKKILFFYNFIFLDKNEKYFIKKGAIEQESIRLNKKIILIQTPMEHYNIIAFNAFLLKTNKSGNFKVFGLWIYSLKPLKKYNYRAIEEVIYFTSSVFFFLSRVKWMKLYTAISVSKFLNIGDVTIKESIFSYKKSKEMFGNIEKKSDILDLYFNNIYIGDLIYDSYIRLRSEPTVDINDYYLRRIIFHAIKYVIHLDRLFSEGKIEKFVTSYAAYINQGVAVRVAVSKGIETYSEGNFVQYFKKLSKDDPFHTPRYIDYSKDFNCLSNKEACLKLAEIELKEKFDGKVSKYSLAHLNTSKINLYSKSNFFKADFDGIIFLHNFYDAPHAWGGKMLFNDYYDWTLFLLNLIKDNQLNIAIKPHPNADLSCSTLISLKKQFSNLKWIDSMLSNNAIYSSGIKFGISMSGSVLSELAYHGITPIAAADNPTSSFNFVTCPESLSKYKEAILNANSIQLPENYLKEVLKFHYMHYMSHIDGINTVMPALHVGKLMANSDVLVKRL